MGFFSFCSEVDDKQKQYDEHDGVNYEKLTSEVLGIILRENLRVYQAQKILKAAYVELDNSKIS